MIAPHVPPVTPGEVLGRLKAAFNLDDWTGPAGFALSSFDPSTAAEVLGEATCDEDGEATCGGFDIRPIPSHNRRSHGPLADPSERCNPALDTAATRMICEHDDPITGKTFDLDELVERCRRKTLTRIRAEPEYWARLCAIRDGLAALERSDRNAELRALEAFGWITEKEDDRDLDEARQLTLFWFQTELPQRAFSQRFGIRRTTLRREIEKYCAALAGRLNAAPMRAAVRRANNDHLYRGASLRKSERLVWQAAITTDLRVHPNDETVVKGAEAIARITRRTSTSALRLIEGGKAPIAMLDGQPAALRELLDVACWRSKVQPATVRESKARLLAA
jgi:hypothetical protein